MICPYCGWTMNVYRTRHRDHELVYRCENGVCMDRCGYVAIERITLAEHQIIHREDIDAPPI